MQPAGRKTRGSAKAAADKACTGRVGSWAPAGLRKSRQFRTVNQQRQTLQKTERATRARESEVEVEEQEVEEKQQTRQQPATKEILEVAATGIRQMQLDLRSKACD